MPVHILDAIAHTPAARGLYMKSYGCQMNVYDGLRIAELMAPQGFGLVEDPADAELVVLNTCHIREKADDKLFSDIGRICKQSPKAIIAVGGCTGQALGAKVMQQAPAVKIVFGPQTTHRLPALLAKIEQGRAQGFEVRAVDTDFPELEKFDHLPTPGAYGPSAFVTIQEGCDKFCTYCVVPYTRGAEICRPAADILREVEALTAQGVKEVVLLGQNVNAYQHGGVSLAQLCEAIAKLPTIARIRFTTSHPNNTTPDLVAAFASNPKLMPYFHLPVQSGSNRTLERMNRNHTVESYLATIASVRATRPDIAISGDFIVGFPGETEEDFMETLKVAAFVGYFGAYSFAYSPRPGTPAADLPDQIDEVTKKNRLAALQAVLETSSHTYINQFIGQTVEVLVEERGNQPGQLRGRSAHNVPVNFSFGEADPLQCLGQLVKVHITGSTPRSLVGNLVA
jgi:tRNA-2-methylthio-N6-dimethylallyladenosine synthase